jgi:arsenate reductase
MIDTIFYLASCDTCRKNNKSLPKGYNFSRHQTRSNNDRAVREMHQMAGSYEALFSKKSTTYKSMDLKDKI